MAGYRRANCPAELQRPGPATTVTLLDKTTSSSDRRQIARKQARLRAWAALAVAFDGETAHAFDQMTSQIDPGAALGAWIIGIETDERVLRRNGQRDFEMS
ncbi:hypothetical protein [Novosphingobium sp. MD-1]|uniref:hypothetical protein n=1 Tax=Novosphingobium sp. MD-1 TaxID=1630648 RepID=UPI001F488F75|nr:hypothetical protein [Novosphingobium sp. MD-1]